jgi:DNA-directed RNA polymerase sigma subunit (sigma70/sigma32)
MAKHSDRVSANTLRRKWLMKIPLNLADHDLHAGPSVQTRELERDIKGAKRNDWNAKANLHRSFHPLLTQMAQKRATEQAKINELIDKGKEGINKAAKKFKLTEGADKFRIFTVTYVENAMDGKSGGFFAKLFGG